MELTDLHYKIAWLYYLQNMSQQEIADDLRITRVKVVRLLKEARDAGAVEIRIDCDKTQCFELEVELRETTGLEKVMVVPSGADPIEAAAAGGAIRFEQALRDATSIAIGVGRTLTSVVRRAARIRKPKTRTIVGMGGFPAHDARYDPVTIAQVVTNKYDVEFYQIKAPIFSAAPEITAALKKAPAVTAAIEMAKNADIAFVSVTGIETCMYLHCGLVSEEERKRLLGQSLVGEMEGHLFTIDGQYSEELSKRNILVPLPLNCPAVAVAGGVERVPALTGVIRSGCIDELITDEKTASELVKQFRGAGAAKGKPQKRPPKKRSAP